MKLVAPIILGYVAAAFAGNRLGNGEWVWAAIRLLHGRCAAAHRCAGAVASVTIDGHDTIPAIEEPTDPNFLTVICGYCNDWVRPERDGVDPDVLWCSKCERTIGIARCGAPEGIAA